MSKRKNTFEMEEYKSKFKKIKLDINEIKKKMSDKNFDINEHELMKFLLIFNKIININEQLKRKNKLKIGPS